MFEHKCDLHHGLWRHRLFKEAIQSSSIHWLKIGFWYSIGIEYACALDIVQFHFETSTRIKIVLPVNWF